MAQHMARVNEIAAAEGISTSLTEQVTQMIKQNDLEAVEASNEGLEETLKVLEERATIVRAEYKAERDLNGRFEQIIIDDLDKITQRYNVLAQYVATVDSDEEFKINKIVSAQKKQIESCFNMFKNFIEKGRGLKTELAKLRELQKKCDELKRVSDPQTQES